ncbi:MAG: tripartite tricarboxylate transporter TctB family protein [Alphaproteobacteria bacterium]|nr:tripartite tricarboxylate transporter TctB family protein [Alphaproteobacteria bacterium]
MRLGDLASGAGLAAFGAAVAWHAAGFPRAPGHMFGAGLFPIVIGGGLVACGGLLVARGAVSGGLRGISLAAWTEAGPRAAAAAAIAIALPVAFIWLLEPVGFLALATGSLVVLFLAVGVPLARSLAISVVASLVCYWLFAKLLRVPLPRGITGFLGF